MFLPKEPACLTSLFMVSLLHPYENCKFFSWDPHIFTQIPGASSHQPAELQGEAAPAIRRMDDGWKVLGISWGYEGFLK